MADATLAQQFEALAEAHALTALSVHFHTASHRKFYSANAHIEGSCTHAIADTPEKALANAIGELNARRTPPVVDVPVLVAADPTTWAHKDGRRAAIAGEPATTNPCDPEKEAARHAQWEMGHRSVESAAA